MIPKFRGKSTADENNDEWVYGNLVFDGKRAIIVNGIDEATDEYIAFKDFCSVDIDTVGQSTGSFDKNGKEIFEGDIVKRYPSPCFKTDWNCKVETVISGDASLLLGEKLGNGIATMPFGTPFSKGNLLEVIGNIYESGELVQWK